MLVDPWLNCILWPISFCKKTSCAKRQELLEKAEEKLTEQLCVMSLLHKVNVCYAALKNILNEHEELVKYNSNFVVEEEPGSENEKLVIGTLKEMKKAMTFSVI